MNIGFDLRPSLSKPTGVGSYGLALAERLPRLAPQDRFFFFSASLRDRYPRNDWPPNVSVVDLRIPVRALNFAWNRLGVPALDRLVRAPLDLIHSPHPLIVPGKRARPVVTIHDLFFLKHPDMTDTRSRGYDFDRKDPYIAYAARIRRSAGGKWRTLTLNGGR